MVGGHVTSSGALGKVIYPDGKQLSHFAPEDSSSNPDGKQLSHFAPEDLSSRASEIARMVAEMRQTAEILREVEQFLLD